jgi:hypothetical protein
MTEPPKYPKTPPSYPSKSRDQREGPTLGDGQGRSPSVLIAVIVLVFIVLIIALHVAGVVGPGTNA